MKSALAIIVTRVKEVMTTQVCSVYLRDAKGGYVLMATDGLNADAVGRVRLAAGEGLVGRVVAREEPINLEHAEAHPSYQYFPETGEERYSAFFRRSDYPSPQSARCIGCPAGGAAPL